MELNNGKYAENPGVDFVHSTADRWCCGNMKRCWRYWDMWTSDLSISAWRSHCVCTECTDELYRAALVYGKSKKK